MDKKLKMIAILLAFLFVSSGFATFMIVNNKIFKKTNIANENQIKKNSESVTNNSAVEFNPNSVFDGSGEIYINDSINFTNAIEISGVDRGFIAANFKGLDKKRIDKSQHRIELKDFAEYDFRINIPKNDISIMLYKNKDFFYIESSLKDFQEFYKSESENLNSFLQIIEKKYLDNQINQILYPIPDHIYLNAKDENTTYVMNKRESREFIKSLKILSIIGKEEISEVSSPYPNYEIEIDRREYKYRFKFINKDTMIIDTPIVHLYCRYTGGAWEYIYRKLPFENDSDNDYIEEDISLEPQKD